jgi:4-hydroxy-tetrahydrodipicolinate reductase
VTNINLAIAGATGWTGSAIVEAALAAPDITLKSAIARRAAGQDLGSALGGEPLGIPVHGDAAGALDGVDVLVEFTSHDGAKEIALAAIERGVAVVIGSSGLTADDFADIDAAARAAGVGAVAAGNFSLTAAMMLAGAELAARHIPRWVPSFVVSTEIVFAAEDERLSLRHDAGPTTAPYVTGVLLAVRRARGHTGLIRGLDRLLLG